MTVLFGILCLPCSEAGDCPVQNLETALSKSTVVEGETLEIVYTAVIDPKVVAENVTDAASKEVVVVVVKE